MNQLQLEPFAALIEWEINQPISAEQWLSFMVSYLETLGQRGTQKQGTIIGHIKGIANFSEGEFIQVSVISPDRPATTTSQFSEDLTSKRLCFALNTLIYGLPYQAANQIAQSSAVELAEQIQGTATFTLLSDPDQADHHHH